MSVHLSGNAMNVFKKITLTSFLSINVLINNTFKSDCLILDFFCRRQCIPFAFVVTVVFHMTNYSHNYNMKRVVHTFLFKTWNEDVRGQVYPNVQPRMFGHKNARKMQWVALHLNIVKIQYLTVTELIRSTALFLWSYANRFPIPTI